MSDGSIDLSVEACVGYLTYKEMWEHLNRTDRQNVELVGIENTYLFQDIYTLHIN